MAMTMPLTTAAQSRKTDWGTTPAPQKKDTVKVVKGTAEAIKDTVKAVKDAETAISTKGLTTPDTAQTVQAETPLTLTPDTLTQQLQEFTPTISREKSSTQNSVYITRYLTQPAETF